MGNETTVILASLTVASVLASASGFWKASELQVEQRLTECLSEHMHFHKRRAEAVTALWLGKVRCRQSTSLPRCSLQMVCQAFAATAGCAHAGTSGLEGQQRCGQAASDMGN